MPAGKENLTPHPPFPKKEGGLRWEGGQAGAGPDALPYAVRGNQKELLTMR